jgi:hypothetical protein
MKLYACWLTVVVVLIVAPVAIADSESASNMPDETAETQADLLQSSEGSHEISVEDEALDQEGEMAEISEAMNTDRPNSSREAIPGLNLPEGLVIRGTRQGGVGIGIGVEF